MRVPTILSLTGAALSISVVAGAAEPDYETLAAELARLRTEVESISAQIEDKKEATRTELRTLASQKTSLEAEIQREELRLKQIEQAFEEVQQKVREAGALQRELQPAVLDAIAKVRAAVAGGLPFRLDERLAELDKLGKDLEDEVVLPSIAVSRLWTFVEDETRLTRENGLYQQIIAVKGEEVLADVARVGMLMLYFRTPDQRFGKVEREGKGWTYVVFEDPKQIERAQSLFASLEKRVRVGFFELPNALNTEVPR